MKKTIPVVLASALMASMAAGAVAEPLSLTPGAYTGSGKGYFSTVEVEVTVSENAIESIQVLSSGETPQIWATVEKTLPERIVEAQSLAVDSITGATVSSAAVRLAVTDALEQAGATRGMLYNPIEKSQEVLDYQADIVVVGAGTSGCSAAAQATDEGAKVCLVEKSARIGGSGSISSGFLGIGSQLQKDQGISYSVENVFNEWMEGQHWMVPNSAMLSKYLNMTGETIDWLVEKGFVIGSITSFDGTDESDVHWFEEPAGNGAFGVAGAQYFNSLVSDVDTILTEVTVKDFLFDEQGKIAGVTGTRYDGATVNVHASKVILATGGFAGNVELQKEFYNGNTYRFFGLTQNNGTAITMGRSVGAALCNPTTACAHFFAPVRDVAGLEGADSNILYDLVITPALLNVNGNGVRFCDESDVLRGYLESAQYRFQQGTYYVILSQSQVDALAKAGTSALGLTEPAANIPFLGHATDPSEPLENIQAVLDAAIAQKVAFKGETAEELAQATGMNAEIFAQNIAHYDALCEAGADTMFYKDAKFMSALGEGPYYAIAACAVPYNTMGGLMIDENCRVMSESYDVIDNLYCVGMDSMGVLLDGTGYPDFGGPATSWSLNSGRIAAQSACAELNQ